MSTRADPELVTAFMLRDWPLPAAGESKHSRGHVLVVGGSPSTPGAVVLAGLAALRVGAGVLALRVAPSTASAVAVAVPEASAAGLPGLDGDAATDNELADAVRSADAVLVGPGLTEAGHARSVLGAVLAARCSDRTALVLDAFALGILRDVLGDTKFEGAVVLTPNPSEASHLLDTDASELERRPAAETANTLAQRYAAAVTYAGAVADPDGQTWTVPTGHAGLGTSGSGDVLAGAAVGLLARGAAPSQSACWATYLHGTAGDRLAARVGRLGFLARELVDELPLVIVQTEV